MVDSEHYQKNCNRPETMVLLVLGEAKSITAHVNNKCLISEPRSISVKSVDKEASRGDDNLHGRSAEKKNTAADQSRADDAELSPEPPTRVHIFKGKPLSGVSAKSDGKQLEVSSIRVVTLIHPRRGAVQAEIPVEIHPPADRFKDGVTRLRGRVEKGKKALYEAAMKAEDLEAIVQALQRTRDRIFNRRK